MAYDDILEELKSKGRYGDTELAHVTPGEAMLLKALGGSGTINPETGLKEYYPDFYSMGGIGRAAQKEFWVSMLDGGDMEIYARLKTGVIIQIQTPLFLYMAMKLI